MRPGFDFAAMNAYEMADYFLFDTYKAGQPGGTGQRFDWQLIEGKSFSRPFFLAGGLDPDNVGSAVGKLGPFAVDVASGVERAPGIKDNVLIERFINAAG